MVPGRPARPTVPLLGFLAALAAAGAWVHVHAGTPEGALHGRVVGYLEALRGGDVVGAQGYRLEPDSSEEARAHTLRGLSWLLTDLEVRLAEDEASVQVTWFRGNRPVRAEREIWRDR